MCHHTLLSGLRLKSHVDSCVSVPPASSGYVKNMKALIDLTLVHSHMHEHVQHQAALEEGGRIIQEEEEKSHHRRGTNLQRSQAMLWLLRDKNCVGVFMRVVAGVGAGVI